jgi:hypothetical protein
MLLAISFVGLAVLLGWALRGQYGHQLGATIPGVLFSLALVLVSGRPDWMQRAPLIALAGGIGFAVGGSASYGILIGYTRARVWTNVLYGFFCLFVVGGLWGAIGGGIVGLALEEVPPAWYELCLLAICMFAGAYLVYHILIVRCRIRMTPPRSDAWAYELGMALILLPFLSTFEYDLALRAAIYGLFGYGLGFVLGNFLQVIGNASGIPFGWWKVMEKSMGFIGGAVLSYGMLSSDAPALPPTGQILNWICIILVFAGIPLAILHRRLSCDRLTKRFAELPFENREKTVAVRLRVARIFVVSCVALMLLTAARYLTGEIPPYSGLILLLAFLALSGIIMSNLQSGFPRDRFESRVVEVSLWIELAALIIIAVIQPFSQMSDLIATQFPSPILSIAAVFAVLVMVSTLSCYSHRQHLPGAHLRWKQESDSTSGERPVIRKLGTLDCDIVETNPVVFQGKVYRFEYMKEKYSGNTTGDSYFRFVNRESGDTTPPFAHGFHMGCAFVDQNTAYVSAVNHWDGERVHIFKSEDLIRWESWVALDLPGYGMFNTSICKTDEDYVMMFEVGKPPEVAGVRFTARFARSADLRDWTLTSPECTYSKDRYTAPHCLRYLDGYFYNFYLEAYEGYEHRVVRSKDLIDWESSPLNPVMKASDEDRQIANPHLSSEQRTRVANAVNINNSDIDFCEHEGRLIINYSWGNQKGIEHLAEAIYDGPESSFLTAWFPDGTRETQDSGDAQRRV